MANNHSEPSSDEFLEQIFGLPNFPSESGLTPIGSSGLGPGASAPMMLQLSSGDGSAHLAGIGASGGYHAPLFPLGLSLEQSGGFLKPDDGLGSGKLFGDGRATTVKNVYHGQPMPTNAPAATHPPAMRPRVRARRGQATDPHSIAERVRRERIAERIRALQELVPSVNKSDRAAMLDEVVDYVKFLRLQVKVLSMSRLGGAGAVVPLVSELPLGSLEDEGGRNQSVWDKWSNDETEQQVAKLMEENVGSAMQFLQSKALCIMPISLATAIYHSQPPDNSSNATGSLDVKSESNPPSL